jgi:CubicO group peptidase (beta-lactamase class C family)
MRRRAFLGSVGSLAVVSGASPLGPGIAPAAAATAAGPPTVTPSDLRFRPRTLRYGSPRRAGLVPEYVDRIVPAAEEFMAPGPDRPNPSHPGFVLLAARDGVVVEHAAHGHAVRYESWDEESGTAVELPRDAWVPMRRDTVFDMASVSKLFTSVVLVSLAESGRLDLTAPVTEYLPGFADADPAKAPIVVRQLLTHTAGMEPFIDLGPYADNAARMAAIFANPLVFEPGTDYAYSDLNLITAAKIAEEITGESLDELVARIITRPLGLSDTGYKPSGDQLRRAAATEYQPWTGRGMVRGTVHDENAWYFGGVAGHAGVFSTARDIAVFAQMIMNGGTYGGHRVLGEKWVRALLTNYNAGLGEDAARGLGWQLDQRFYMDALSTPVTFGHTGYTGTCLAGDPVSGTLFVLLTNRVHPTREWGTTSEYRRAPARELARAVPVRPAAGRAAWFSQSADDATATLTVPLERAVAEDASLRFRLWYDTEATDVCAVEATTDGSDWQPVPLELRSGGHRWSTDGKLSGFSGRRWHHVRAALPDGVRAVRWTYTTDADQHGRGVYVDDIRVLDGSRQVFHGERPRDRARIETDGWRESAD